MEFSPRRPLYHRKLYRNRMLAVILAASTCLVGAWLAAQAIPRYGHKTESVKGPRALGLIELSPAGNKGRIIPIAIMMDGKFYDAGSYKAAPIPMALDFGVVYEGFRTGVSQGIFTITQPGQMNHVWIAEGTWLPEGQRPKETSKKYSTPVIEDDSKDGPPVLHRRGEKTDSDGQGKNKNSDKDQQEPPAPAASSPTAPPASPSTTPATAPPAAAKPPAPASESDEPIADPNRPRLRRGKPDSASPRQPYATFEPLTPGASSAGNSGPVKAGARAKGAAAAAPQITFIPAISDAGGPDPRPYTYEVKPDEEAIYRSKMLDFAATQMAAQASAAAKQAAATNKASASKPVSKRAVRLPKPAFDDVNLRIFDLSNSNQPVLVLSAKTHPPASSATATASIEEPQEITLIARTNLEGELQKLFFSQTDSRHLYSAPSMELIDAIDVDGDGRGELLFRRTFDDGSAYAIYRVTSDRLWPLFEGTP
jgi:hypothetical protein